MKQKFWRNFLTGLLVIFPALVTLGILQFLFGWIFRMVVDPVAKLVAFMMSQEQASWMVRLMIAAGFVGFTAAIGWGTRLLMIRRVVSLGEAVVRKVPMVGKIYGTLREIADTFAGRRKGLFSRVVLVEWPKAGVYSIGFVTAEVEGEMQAKTPVHVVNVFIPTTPTPTSGFLVLVPRDSLISLTLSVEEGMRLVISAGASGPIVEVPKENG